MSLSREIEAIGDDLVAAFNSGRLAGRLDYLLERLESAAIRAAALEEGTRRVPVCRAPRLPAASAVIIPFGRTR